MSESFLLSLLFSLVSSLFVIDNPSSKFLNLKSLYLIDLISSEIISLEKMKF